MTPAKAEKSLAHTCYTYIKVSTNHELSDAAIFMPIRGRVEQLR